MPRASIKRKTSKNVETERMTTRSKSKKIEKEDPAEKNDGENTEKESSESNNEKFSPLEVLMNSDLVKQMLDYYETELLLVGDSPEERREREQHPERPIIAMRNTTSSHLMMGLIAGWIKEVQTIKLKEPDAAFRKLCALTFSAFKDDHWICDTEDPEVIFFLVHEIAKLWKYFLSKTDEILKISDPVRKELKEMLKSFAKKLKSLSEDFEHSIEFITTSAKLKYKVKSYDLDEITDMGVEVGWRRFPIA